MLDDAAINIESTDRANGSGQADVPRKPRWFGPSKLSEIVCECEPAMHARTPQ